MVILLYEYNSCIQINKVINMIKHPFPPIYNKNSVILILGSFPSVKSREQKFFYGHPQNRIWKVISSVFQCNEPVTVEEKKQFLFDKCIALWDVIASCEITGSSDSSVRNVVVNDISKILNEANISQIFVNGRTAEKYFNLYIKNKINTNAVFLPSTSSANASWSFERLVEKWEVLKNI